MTDCVFCGIVNGKIPARRALETDDVIAFHDLHPAAPTHVLVIPRRHIATLDDATDGDAAVLGKMLMAARQVAAEAKLESYRLVMNVQAGAGQSVFHVHLHVLGGRSFAWPPF
ncbi:MAG TPA: histidine triad nucleotide-binding protein [Candidatus Krumholzibacteria bacterium]